MTVFFPLFFRRPQAHRVLVLFVMACLGSYSGRVSASQSVELSWNSSPTLNVVSYKVYYGTQSHQYSDSVVYADVSDVSIPGLADGVTYYFAVSATDTNGVESALSNEAVYVVPAPGSIDLQAQATTAAMQAVDLSWTPSTDPDVYGYIVNYGTQSGLYTNSVTFYYATDGIISGLAAGFTYYFSVSSIDAYGVGLVASSEVSYTVPIPTPLVLQSQTPDDTTGVELTWNAIPNDGVASYNIYYGTASGVYTSSMNCGNVTDFVVRGLIPGQTYYFAVAPVDGYGNHGNLSNEASSPAAAPVPIAIQVQGSPQALEAVDVSWTASTDSDVYGYAVDYWTPSAGYTNSIRVYYDTDGVISGLTGGATYTFTVAPIGSVGVEPIASGEVSYTVPAPVPLVLQAQKPAGTTGVELTWNTPANEGIVGYIVYYGTQSGSYPNSVQCGNVNDFIVRGLTPGQTYYFVVVPLDAYGNQGNSSNEASSQPAAPAPLVVQVQGTTAALGAVDVSWTASTDGDVYGYAVDYWTPGAGYTNWTEVGYTTNAIISGLASGTNCFAIAPISSEGVEPIASGMASYTVPPPPPIVLHAKVQTNSPGINLSWNAVPNEGIVDYYVYYGTDSGSYPNFAGSATTNGFLVQGLVGGQTYYFAVTAVDGYGNQSPFSSEASAVAPLPAPMVLQTQVYTDGNGQPDYMEIYSITPVYGSWEMDYSADLQNWSPYQYGYGNGNADGYDVDVYTTMDPTQPQMFFRVINN